MLYYSCRACGQITTRDHAGPVECDHCGDVYLVWLNPVTVAEGATDWDIGHKPARDLYHASRHYVRSQHSRSDD